MTKLLEDLQSLLNPDAGDEIPLEERIHAEIEGIPVVEVEKPTEPTLGPVVDDDADEPQYPEQLRRYRHEPRKIRARQAVYKEGKNKFDLNIAQMPDDFQKGVGDYFRHIINNRGFSKWTLHAYKIAIGWFLVWALKKRGENPNFNPLAMELRDADSFKYNLIEDEVVTPLYTNNIILALRSLYSFLFIREYIQRNVFAHLEIIKERIAEMRNPPTRGQVMEIINRYADSDPKKMIFALAFFSGLRRSELASVKRTDFTGEKVGDREIIYVKVFGKGNKERTVLVYDQEGVVLLDRLLKANEAPDTELLVGYHVDYISHVVEKESGIPDGEKRFTTHSMRHAYATALRNLGVPIDVIARFLGHSNLTTTQIYMHMRTEDATKEVLSKL